MAEILSCRNLEKSIGNRMLFQNLNFSVLDKERIGLIGPNGSGKSTLLKILADIEEKDAGEITSPSGLKLVYIPQVEEFDGEDTVLEAAVKAAEGEMEEAYIKEANASIYLSRIGFENVHEKVKNLSGGWLKRLSIARQIAREPDILLLDEPTNHLDLEGIEWLEAFLKKVNYPYILITHDRDFLENATNRIIELNEIFEDGLLSYNCAYNEFMNRRAAFIEAEKSRYESLSNKNRREQEWVKSGVRARGTKQKARLNEADNLAQEVSKLKKQTSDPVKIMVDFDSTDRKTKRLLVAHSISKSYADKKIIEDLTFTLTPGVRIGLLGLNGAGKTTCIKMIAGEETPDKGGVTLTNGVKILHFDQKRQLMNENAPLKDALSLTGGDMVIYRGEQMHISSWARKLKFRSDQLDTPVSSLSGGERARIIMGRLMLQSADILLLDEPTNDLDIPSIEVLEESLMTFPGAIVFITHDRALLDRVSTILFALEGDGVVTPYASYHQWKEAQKATSSKSNKAPKVEEPPTTTKGNKPKSGLTKLSYKDQRDLETIEERIMEAEEELEYLQNNPISHDDTEAFIAYCAEMADAGDKVEALYARWEELQLMLQEIEENKK